MASHPLPRGERRRLEAGRPRRVKQQAWTATHFRPACAASLAAMRALGGPPLAGRLTPPHISAHGGSPQGLSLIWRIATCSCGAEIATATAYVFRRRRFHPDQRCQSQRQRTGRGAARRLFQRRRRRGRGRVPVGRARAGARRAPGPRGAGLRLGHHPVAGRHRAHQQPRGRGRLGHRAGADRCAALSRARARPRPRHRHRRAAGRDQRSAAGGAARQLQEASSPARSPSPSATRWASSRR